MERGDPSWVNDTWLSARMQTGARALLEAGRAVPVGELVEQLNRTECTLALPDAPERPVDEPAVDSVELYEQASDAVAVVGGLYACGRCTNWHLSSATGFFLTEDGTLVTNYHVVDQADRRGLFAMARDGRVFPVVEVLAADETADAAILKLEAVDHEGNEMTFPTLPLAEASRVGEAVRVISHADSRHYVLTQGVVSRRYAMERERHGDHWHDGGRWITITADYARGSSGGPVLNAAGAVIGMVASTSSVYCDEDEAGRPQNLQMVWKQCVPVEAIRGLMAEGMKEEG